MADPERPPAAAGPADATAEQPRTAPPADGGTLSSEGSFPASDADLTALLAPAEAAGEVGRLGGFKVLRLLGRGGMGAVFAGEDPRLGRKVALKVMLPAVAANPTAKGRFLREAKSAAAVEHEHIIPIYHVGEDRGVPFLAMPMLPGEPLDARLAGRAPLPVAEVLLIGGQVAEGLAAAHESGLIHRDIKPSNVWLEARPGGDFRRVRILDFGLARLARDDNRLTNSGAVLGTPAYMAPEQARGQAVDARADVFSLGCVLYQMATGRRPFTGPDTFAVLTAIAVDTPPPPAELNPAIPPRLSALILRMLAKNPDHRPPSARAVADELAAIGTALALGSGPVAIPLADAVADADDSTELVLASAADRPVRGGRPAPSRRRGSGVWWLVAGLLLVVGVLAAFAPTIIRIVTNTGELVLAVDDPGIEVTVKRNGAVVEDRTKNRKFVLTAGDGEVEFHDPETGAKAFTKTFRIERGGKDVLTARMQDVAAARPKPGPKPGSAPALPAQTRLAPDPVSPVLAGHTGSVRQIRFVPGGNKAVSAAWDGTVRLWDLDTGTEERQFKGSQNMNCVAVSPDGGTVAAGDSAFKIWLWNLKTGAFLEVLRTKKPAAEALLFTPDGRFLLAGVGDELSVFDFARRQPVAGGKLLTGGLIGLVPLPGGKQILCHSLNDAAVWDVEAQAVARRLARFPPKALHAAAFADGKRVASMHADGFARVLSVEDGSELAKFRAHSDRSVHGTHAFVLPGDHRLLTTGDDKAVCVWDAVTFQKLDEQKVETLGTGRAAVSDDARRLLTGAGWRLTSKTEVDDDFRLRLWQLPDPPR